MRRCPVLLHSCYAALILIVLSTSAIAQNYAFEQHVHAVGQGNALGHTLALDGDTLATTDIDAAGNDLYVYSRAGNAWSLAQAIDLPNWNPVPLITPGIHSRFRLALSGDMLVVGSPADTIDGAADIGSILIYRKVGNSFSFQQRIPRPSVNPLHQSAVGNFGAAIAIHGDRMVVGAPGRSAYGRGTVFEFARNGNTWSHVGTIDAPAGNQVGSFGQALAFTGERLLVGQPQFRRARVYRRVGGNWTLDGTLGPGNNHPDIEFATDVALSGDYAFVAAPAGPVPDGNAAHVFFRSGGVWGLVQRLTTASSERFGSALAVHGDRLAVSDTKVMDFGEDRVGRIVYFERNGLYWSERQRLYYPFFTGPLDVGFGARLALDHQTLLAASGVPAPGANGDTGQIVAYRRPAPKLHLSTPLEFGPVAVGSTSAGRNLLLSNTGNASLTIHSIQVALAPFAKVNGGSCPNLLPIVLPAGGSCTLRYTFAPAASGVASQNLSFTSNDPTGPTVATLSGTGALAQLLATPGDLYVGFTVVGVPTAPATLTLQNSSAVSLTVQSIGTPAAPFSVVAGGSCLAPPFTLAPGQSCTRRYVYSPTVAGSASTLFSINSTAANNPLVVSLSGFADGPGLSLNAGPTLDFGPNPLGSPSATLTQTLFSSGVSDLLVSAITPPAAPFERVGGTCGTPPFSLPPDVSCTLVYRFLPDALGASSSILAVSSNAEPAVQSFTLQGSGTVPALLIGNNPLDLGGAKLGQSSPVQSASLSNIGNAPLSISAIGAAAAPFARIGGSCANPPFVLAPGQMCTLSYQFTAAVVGDAAQSLAISSNDPASPGSLQLLARGTRSTLTLEATPVDFGSVAVGQTLQRSLSLSNTGNEAIAIDALGSVSAPYAQIPGDCPAPPFVLDEGDSCALGFAFSPVAKGLFERNLSLSHTADTGPSSITLRGRGAPAAPLITPATLQFGIAGVGEPGSIRTLTLTNTAPVPLDVGSLILTGGLDFTLLSDGCSNQSLPAASQCQVGVRFAPLLVGYTADQLLIPSDAVGAPGAVTMDGTGVIPLIFRNGFESP